MMIPLYPRLYQLLGTTPTSAGLIGNNNNNNKHNDVVIGNNNNKHNNICHFHFDFVLYNIIGSVYGVIQVFSSPIVVRTLTVIVVCL